MQKMTQSDVRKIHAENDTCVMFERLMQELKQCSEVKF